MTGPFTITSPIMAVLSDDRRHRYWLVRQWDRKLPILVTCMFNPSTANEHKDDPTIRELCAFAKLWGYGGILVINLHSIRSSDPREVRLLGKDAWGDAQPQAWAAALDIAATQGTPVLVAWGNLASAEDVEVFKKVAEGMELVCLGHTANGSPKHPLARGRHRVSRDQRPVAWLPLSWNTPA